MSKFPDIIAKHFTTSIRLRGLSYLNRIDIKSKSDALFGGIVEGQNNLYEVWLRKEQKNIGGKQCWGLQAHCSCPFAEKEAHCKHIWALLLLSEKKHWFPEKEAVLSYSFIVYPDASWQERLKSEGQTKESYVGEENIHYVDLDAADAKFHSEMDTEFTSSSAQASRSSHDHDEWQRQQRRHFELKRWRTKIQSLATTIESSTPRKTPQYKSQEALQISYVLAVDSFQYYPGYRLQFYRQVVGKKYSFAEYKPQRLSYNDLKRMPDEQDRLICGQLLGVTALSNQNQIPDSEPNSHASVLLSYERFVEMLPQLFASGRFLLKNTSNASDTLNFQKVANVFIGAKLRISFRENSDAYGLTGTVVYKDRVLQTEDEFIAMDRQGVLINSHRELFLLDKNEDIAWMKWLDLNNDLYIPKREIDLALGELFERVTLPSEIELPPKTTWVQEKLASPKFCFLFDQQVLLSTKSKTISGSIAMEYGSKRFLLSEQKNIFVDQLGKICWKRDLEQENNLLNAALHEVNAELDGEFLKIPRQEFMSSLLLLAERGFIIESSNKKLRTPSKVEIKVKSGIDWLDVNSKIQFDGIEADLPDLLAAARNQQDFVTLHDGSVGLIPKDLQRKLNSLLNLSRKNSGIKSKDSTLRFGLDQALVLDLLLQEEQNKNYDEKYLALLARFRELNELNDPNSPSLKSQAKLTSPPGFLATLRDYQLSGLSWLRQLHSLGIGGILADDMGLGKTVQVLAHLHDIYINQKSEKYAPSLLVVPRSLIYNWQKEAERFSPQLRVLDLSLADRKKKLPDLSSYHLILSTYTTMTKDITELRKQTFHYVILDEAQFIKNKDAQSAKAARLLQAKHRLAMSGTPVENHLGELWSLFEFINPGLLGRSSERNLLQTYGFDSDKAQLELIKRLVKPYILRRTKSQVLKDLPEKTEKTLYCVLDTEQREEYDRLKQHYRTTLEDLIETEGIGRSKIKILEALTRLRQAACHLALIDKNRKGQASAKLDHLLEHIENLRAEGHKALIFSQFTSMLKIVGEELKARGTPYLYLDGATKNRQALVEGYQNSADIQLFLISIKAGGVGLNLTSADYCFILDPWWNPAVEAQAIDRAHRIGQKNPVIAYRLIAKDTVEEKILELQGRKRELVESVISEDSSLLKNLDLNDLRQLLD
ncbi:MAG: DEAD/DEAH box helicase [Oligoflexales bacterium]|nr:DEAD/DEAH box helicase [Oligoflexales bacterium]